MTRPLSILLVEGQSTDADMIRLLLAQSPHGEFLVEHAGALRDAVTLVRERRFDVVLLDISLPDSTGLNAVKQLKAVAADLPLVVLTAHDDEDLALEAIRCGAQEYLSKEHIIGQLLVRVVRHSIARQQQLQEAQTQALTDALTGIGNRRAFDLELARRLGDYRRHGTGCSVMLLDLDHFKSVNDCFGHDLGDEVLQGVSSVLRSTLRETDLAARYGGEEFGVILPITPLTDAYSTAERVRLGITLADWTSLRQTLLVTASSGLAELRPNDDKSSLLQRADDSLYLAKSMGRNRCCWHDGDTPRFGFDALPKPMRLSP